MTSVVTEKSVEYADALLDKGIKMAKCSTVTDADI